MISLHTNRTRPLSLCIIGHNRTRKLAIHLYTDLQLAATLIFMIIFSKIFQATASATGTHKHIYLKPYRKFASGRMNGVFYSRLTAYHHGPVDSGVNLRSPRQHGLLLSQAPPIPMTHSKGYGRLANPSRKYTNIFCLPAGLVKSGIVLTNK